MYIAFIDIEEFSAENFIAQFSFYVGGVDSSDHIMATDYFYLYYYIKENLLSLMSGCLRTPPKLEGLGQ